MEIPYIYHNDDEGTFTEYVVYGDGEELEVIHIEYNDNENCFIDTHGVIEYDMSGIMPISDILKFKKTGGIYYCEGLTPNVLYEIDFPERDVSRSIYYDLDLNTMFDEDGSVLVNIFSIVTPNDLLLFKKNKKSIFIVGVTGGFIEMVYPDEYNGGM